MSLLDRLMPALPDLQEAATLLSGSVYTVKNFPFMYSQKILCKVSAHCKLFSIYVFPKIFCQVSAHCKQFPIYVFPKMFCQVSVHCKQFPIYAFPKNILPSQCTLQTISHLCISKKDLAQVSLLTSTKYFLSSIILYIVLSGIMIF